MNQSHTQSSSFRRIRIIDSNGDSKYTPASRRCPVDHCCKLWYSVYTWGIYRFHYMHTCIKLPCLMRTTLL